MQTPGGGSSSREKPGGLRDQFSLHFTIGQSIRNSFSVWIIAGFVALATWYELRSWVPFAWFVAVGSAFTWRVHYLRPGLDLTQIRQHPFVWARRLRNSTLVCGAVVATGSLLFFPGASDYLRMYLTMIFCAWLSGSLASVGARFTLYRSYALIFIGGTLVAWLRTDSPRAVEIAMLLALFTVIAIGFGKRFAQQVDEGIEIRMQNEELIARLTDARIAAEESSAAKSRFLVVASHDLRQPLHAVTMLNGMLARAQSAERIGEITRQIDRALTTLSRLFVSVLDFSKLETGRVTPEPSWTLLSFLMDRVRHDYEAPAAGKGLRIESRAAPYAIYTDPELFERVLRNLVENAVKFTERGHICLSAEKVETGSAPALEGDAVPAGEDAAGAPADEPGLRVVIADTGPGIPGNLREEIFKEYFQAAADARSGGLGLGLAIVRRLVRLLGMRIGVRDAQPVGTRFEIFIPAKWVQDAPAGEEQKFEQGPELDLTGMRVVYIDDDAYARDAVGMLLADWGCESFVAATPAEAFAQIDKRAAQLGFHGNGINSGDDEEGYAPQVILSDYSLGQGLTGVEVIERFRARYGPLSGAIFTGEASASEMKKLVDIEYPVLMKPVAAKDLRQLLEVFKSLD